MELNYTAIIEELWTRIRDKIDDQIASAAEIVTQAAQHAGNAAASASAAAQSAIDAKDMDDVYALKAHKHTSADITNSVSTIGSSSQANRVLQSDGNGRFYYTRTPTTNNEIANRSYVKDGLDGKVDNSRVESTSTTGTGMIVTRRTNSHNIQVPSSPAQSTDAASRSYVDGKSNDIRYLTSTPSGFASGVIYLIRE